MTIGAGAAVCGALAGATCVPFNSPTVARISKMLTAPAPVIQSLR